MGITNLSIDLSNDLQSTNEEDFERWDDGSLYQINYKEMHQINNDINKCLSAVERD